MALDRENKDNAYLTGRLIAVTEHYASKRFGPGTLSEAYNHPARIIEVFSRYIDRNDEYYREIEAIPPVTVYNADEKSRMMIGYYHQRAAYDNDANDNEARKRIGQRIADLRSTLKWTDGHGVHRVGMSQSEFADLCGLSQSHISRIEAGRYSLRLGTLQQIAEALGGNVDIVV